MDKNQLSIEYMSILTESHPGLTFEEYRECCVFILFYEYCCLRHGEELDDRYKLKELVRLAIRGKLQIPSFLRFMEAASSFIHLSGCPFRLMDLSFADMLKELHSQEKQKSLARFIRKLIKKIDAWDSDDLLFENYGIFFGDLVTGFARARKDTHLSEAALSLYQLFFDLDHQGETGTERTLFVPEFRYGLLFKAMASEEGSDVIMGYDSGREHLEIFRILCYMREIPEDRVRLFDRKSWEDQDLPFHSVDRLAAFMPEGPGSDGLLADPGNLPWDKDLFSSRSKGELPFVLSALPYLKEGGSMVLVFPSALLYREGKESQIRRYLIEELNCLDAVVLLPDSLFVSAGQQEVLLSIKPGRKEKDVLFFDCSDLTTFGREELDRLREGLKSRKGQTGYCAAARPEDLKANDYNLNLPRYISKTEEELLFDLDAKKARIEEIDKELKDIEEKIAMYRRALEL